MVLVPILLVIGLAGVTTVEVTGKSLTDHAISVVKGQDCRMARVFKHGDVCQPESSVTISSPDETTIVRTGGNSVQNMEDMFEQRKQSTKK